MGGGAKPIKTESQNRKENNITPTNARLRYSKLLKYPSDKLRG